MLGQHTESTSSVVDLLTGTVTFLFTDIERSTTRWEQHREAMQTALARHDAILRQAIASHGGVIFKTMGDAFYAAFIMAPGALLAVLAAQYALKAAPWPGRAWHSSPRSAISVASRSFSIV